MVTKTNKYTGTEISLVPHSGIQFLDMEWCEDTHNQNFKIRFFEKSIENADSPGSIENSLYEVKENDDDGSLYETYQRLNNNEIDENRTYTINFKEALRHFEGAWLPLPYLHDLGNEGFSEGPKSWARVFIAPRANEDSKAYEVTFAFDTCVTEDSDVAWGNLRKSDQSLDLAYKPTVNSWMLNESWLTEWLKNIVKQKQEQKKNKKKVLENDDDAVCVHWAYYLVLLGGLKQEVGAPKVKIIDTLAGYVEPKIIDLVVDIGNSRTCGLLIERPSENSPVDELVAAKVELRDLTNPSHVYSEPFRSRMEFREANLAGDNARSRLAGAKRPMFWASFARIGVEADFLNSQTDGSIGQTGVSGPKRYLWDFSENSQSWKLNDFDIQTNEKKVKDWAGPLSTHLDNRGEIRDYLELAKSRDKPKILSRQTTEGSALCNHKFTRSSLFTFFVTELVLQSITQINSVAYRKEKGNSGVPRRLGRIIFTLPTTSLLLEQQIMRHRCLSAVHFLWQSTGWDEIIQNDTEPRHFTHLDKPSVSVSYDEASCSQVLYLYSEVSRKFGGTIRDYFSLMGNDRTDDKNKVGPSYRIASLDIGGGTMDLMIMTYHASDAGNSASASQNFRDGFRVAGDDILEGVIQKVVVPSIIEHLTSQDKEALSGDFEAWLSTPLNDIRESHNRKLFVNYVLAPIALKLLENYERTSDGVGMMMGEEIGELIANSANSFADTQYLSLLPDEFVDSGISNAKISVTKSKMEEVVRGVVGDLIEHLASVIAEFDCDLLLITGRPSKLPAIKNILTQSLPIRIDRIVFMQEYRLADGWYPYVNSTHTIDDPKTTVAVGALLCSLAENRSLQSFSIRAGGFALKSIARFMGVLNTNNLIPADNVFLKDGERKSTNPIDVETKLLIGYRQLNNPDWPATPIYIISEREPKPGSMPDAKVWLAREGIDDLEEGESIYDLPEYLCIEDQGDIKVKLVLQTTLNSEAYWLDSGKLSF